MIFSIEGNIGSGKSTFCKYLKEHFSKNYNKPHNSNVLFVDEPVDNWIAIEDSTGNLLEHFYECPEKYAYCFQMTAYISRLVNLKKAIKESKSGDTIIMERSVFSDYNVFARMLYDSGKINEIEFQSYKMWFDHFLEDLPPFFYVYIKTDFKNCHVRVLNRSRVGESPITEEYLEMCEKYHEDWLSGEKYIITFDGNKDTTSHPEYLDILKQMINYKMNVPDNFNDNDSDNEYYYEATYQKDKWRKRLLDKNLEECKKRTKKE
tara:strand:- start:473 stop:1261 length:789 start_codon:yes stop_codon:yes gene_type:complete